MGVLIVVYCGLFYAVNRSLPADYPEYATAVLKQMGARIRQLRIQKGFSNYEDFAYYLEISRSQMWRYENGKDLHFTTLLRIIHGLEISLPEFFSDGF